MDSAYPKCGYRKASGRPSYSGKGQGMSKDKIGLIDSSGCPSAPGVRAIHWSTIKNRADNRPL